LGSDELARFTLTERLVHWLMALDVLTLLATGAILYFPAISSRVGRRLFIANLHTLCGILVLVPLVVALAGPTGRALRDDVVRLTRINAREWRWFDRTHRMKLELGKFNPGQKLNAIFVTSGLTVLLVTGLALRFPNSLPLTVRQGATFVHDWFAFGVGVLVLGHIAFAFAHPGAMRGMIRGAVRRSWAERYAPSWLREHTEAEDESQLDNSAV
jgi:formate dehydrogenase subunit gamma